MYQFTKPKPVNTVYKKVIWHFNLIIEDRLNEKIEKASRAKMYITKISKLSLTRKD